MDYVINGDRAEFLLVAVADGAGSALMSHLGSKIACTAAVLYLKSNLGALRSSDLAGDCVRQSFAAARREVEELAHREDVDLRQFATTLLVTAVGPSHAVFGQVGDGSIVWGEPGQLRIAHWPDQIALNLTDFLTSAPLEETLHVTTELSAVRRVACMTDGLAPVLLDFRARGPHAPIFERLFATCRAAPDEFDLAEGLSKFLNSPQVNERTDDDKTLVLAVSD